MAAARHRQGYPVSDVTSTTSRRPSRRAVVRTAAHAAWAVPAIQIAAAAPAFASSLVNDIQGGSATITKSGPTQYTASGITVASDGPTALASGTVQLLLTVAGGKNNPVWAATPAPAATGSWLFLGGVDSHVLTFVYNGTVGKGATTPLAGTLTASLTSAQGGPTVTASFVYTGPA